MILAPLLLLCLLPNVGGRLDDFRAEFLMPAGDRLVARSNDLPILLDVGEIPEGHAGVQMNMALDGQHLHSETLLPDRSHIFLDLANITIGLGRHQLTLELAEAHAPEQRRRVLHPFRIVDKTLIAFFTGHSASLSLHIDGDVELVLEMERLFEERYFRLSRQLNVAHRQLRTVRERACARMHALVCMLVRAGDCRLWTRRSRCQPLDGTMSSTTACSPSTSVKHSYGRVGMGYVVVTHIVMAYVVMGCVVMAHIVMAHIVMASTIMTYTAMAYTVMPCTVMACIVMAYAGMAYTVTACIVTAYAGMAHTVLACIVMT